MLLTCRSISPGIARGVTHVIDGRRLLAAAANVASCGRPDFEFQRLRDAIDLAVNQLDRVQRQLSGQLETNDIAIFGSHAGLLRDEQLIDRFEQRILAEGESAEAAVSFVIGELVQQFQSHPVALLQDKANDLLDIGRRLLHCLSAGSRTDEEQAAVPAGDGVVIVAATVTPSELVRFAHRGVAAIITEACGMKSHTAILARGMGIPLVTGVFNPGETVPDGVPVFVDANEGRVLIAPVGSDDPLIETMSRRIEQFTSAPTLACPLPVTSDGVRLRILLNISDPIEAHFVREFGADGVGLFRTEFLYIDRSGWLTADESYAIYHRVAEALGDAELTVRLVDFGAEKCPPYADIPISRNPSLGLRGIRLLLQRPDILQPQVAALARLGRERPISVILPMLDTIDTLEATVEELCRYAGVPDRASLPFKLGTMIEVPAAACLVEDILPYVDSLSIGLNDLTQYLFAADRDDETVERYHDPLQPALLRMLRRMIDAANGAGKPLTICGELAGDPSLTGLLMALGVRRFSVSRTNYRGLIDMVRGLSWTELYGLGNEVLKLTTGRAVRERLDRRFGRGETGAE
jgi:phosphoenolpyruvate-protein phosphotransferase (PTS system enzyme I)